MQLLVRRPVRTDRLMRGLVVAALAGLAALWVLALASRSPSTGAPSAGGRVAVVVDAVGRPRAALERARALGGRDAAVRAPRTTAEASADVRYFAAQGYGRVVVVGSLAFAAARAAAGAYPRTRFVTR